MIKIHHRKKRPLFYIYTKDGKDKIMLKFCCSNIHLKYKNKDFILPRQLMIKSLYLTKRDGYE